MNQQIKEFYEKEKSKITTNDDWTMETVEIGREELDEQLLPKEEYQNLCDDIIASFYGIGDDVVYSFQSSVHKDQLLVGLLRQGEHLDTTTYLPNNDEGASNES